MLAQRRIPSFRPFTVTSEFYCRRQRAAASWEEFRGRNMSDTATTSLYDRAQQRDSAVDAFLRSPSPTALSNHPTRSVTAIDGWKSVLFGVPFLAGGVAIALGTLYANPARKHAPGWLIYLIGSFFFAAGAFLIIHGLRGVDRRAAYRREVAANPGQIWLADYHWQREGFSFSAMQEMLSRFLGAVVWYAFLVPFFWVGLTQHGLNRMFFVFGALFALLGLYFWVRWARMVADLFRYGNSVLYFNSFPYFPGSTFDGRLNLQRNLDAIDELTLTFRCVQEKYVTTGTGQNRTTSVVCYELYRDATTFSRVQLASAGGTGLAVSFRIPQEQPVTRLSDAPPTYWEIEARGKGRGADYEAYFLIPVYQQ